MADFQINGTITSTNQTELMSAMNWFATNYPTKIQRAEAFGKGFILTFKLLETTYADALSTLTALQTEFGTRLGDTWNMVMV